MSLHYSWPCKYCEFIGDSRRKLQQHHKDIHHFGHEHAFPAWNAGLTKYTDNRVWASSQKLKNSLSIHRGHPVSETTRRKISETARKNGNSGGYRMGSGFKNIKRGHYKGIWCDSSWELAFLIYCLEHNIMIARNTDKFVYFINNTRHYYTPDFIVGSTYIEIKGRVDEKWKYKLEQFPHQKHLRVYYQRDMKCFLTYVRQKYGKKFTDLYDGVTYVKSVTKCKRKYNWVCKYCDNMFETRAKLYAHRKLCDKFVEYTNSRIHRNYSTPCNNTAVCELNGVLKDVSGRYNHQKYTESVWIERKNRILQSGIDLTRYGWVTAVENSLGYSKRIIKNTIAHFPEVFNGHCFTRHNPPRH